jgi:hypothetical protein
MTWPLNDHGRSWKTSAMVSPADAVVKMMKLEPETV